ncbi:MAG: hypothetical protein K2X27_24925 [Candidatus Obscuribacterales bacterium]|nr:hypothetical protein [Candidatus Obscuribacterales bacterium]
MYLTYDDLLGGNNLAGVPEDLSYIVKYDWPSSQHMKEAIKIFLSARLDSDEDEFNSRFEPELSQVQKEAQLRLARNPETTAEVLAYLRKIADARVCEAVALNPSSSESTLRSLLSHSEPEVRAALTENPHCPITVLYRLSKDEHPDVRYRLAENSNLPNSILEDLIQDENPFVSTRARETTKRLISGSVVEGRFRSRSAAMRLRSVSS